MARRHIRRNNQQPEPAKANGRTKTLTTSGAVIEALGGLAPMAKLTSKAAKRDVKTQHVWNWKAKGKLPPAYYLIHLRALHGKRCDAPAELWRIISLPAK
jgi:hypothetical protein